MTPSTPASTLTDDQIDEAQSECDAFLCDNCDIRIHQFAREIERLVRATPPAIPDRNLEGAGEFVTALMLGQPIWPNAWGQDVAAAAFFLTDNGKRSTALSTPAAVEVTATSTFDAIKHGDEKHRAWLKAALFAHFDGHDVPECDIAPAAVEVSDEQLDDAMRVCMTIANRYAFVGDAAFPRGREKLRAALSTLAATLKPPEAAASVQGPSDAMRWRTLMALSGARRRIWNHVVDEELKIGRHSIEAVIDALATPVVQGEPVAPSARALAIADQFVSHPDVVRDLATLIMNFATPAPSPKEPVEADPMKRMDRPDAESMYSITAHDYAKAPIGSRDWTLFWNGWQYGRAALATRGPIGAVEPEADILKEARRVVTFYTNYGTCKQTTAAIERLAAVLALSRTPGAGNAD